MIDFGWRYVQSDFRKKKEPMTAVFPALFIALGIFFLTWGLMMCALGPGVVELGASERNPDGTNAALKGAWRPGQ